MSDTQEPVPGNAPNVSSANPSDKGRVLAESERTRLTDELVEMRHTIIDSRASRMALIVGVVVFLLLGKLGLTLAGVLGVAAGAVAYFAKKASLRKMFLDSIPGYDDERLRHWHTQAMLDIVAAQKRSSILRGTFVFIGIVLLIVWIVARVQR